MRKILEAVDDTNLQVCINSVDIENIVRKYSDSVKISSVDVIIEENTMSVTVLSNVGFDSGLEDSVVEYVNTIINCDIDSTFNVSSVKVGGEPYVQTTINITATDSTVEKRRVVESFVKESIDISDIMDSSVSSLSFEILKEIESSSKPFFNMNTFNLEAANQVAEYISDLDSFADVLDEYKYELSDGGYSLSIKPNVSFDFKDRSYQYQVMINLVVGDSSIIKELISSLKSNVKDFVKIQAKGNTINIATKFF